MTTLWNFCPLPLSSPLLLTFFFFLLAWRPPLCPMSKLYISKVVQKVLWHMYEISRRVLYSRKNQEIPKNKKWFNWFKYYELVYTNFFWLFTFCWQFFNPRPLYFTSSSRLSKLYIYNFYLSGYIYFSIYFTLFFEETFIDTRVLRISTHLPATHPSTIFILQFTTVSWSLRVFVSSGMRFYFFFYYSWNMGNKFLTQKIF